MGADMSHVVYKATNKVNGKVYVGKTNNLARRKVEHLCKSRCKGSAHFHRALNKYGLDNFVFEILEEHESGESAYEAETRFIAAFQSSNKRVGYNMTPGGEGLREVTPQERQRRSLLAKSWTGPRNHFFGRYHTSEAKAKMAEAARKRVGPNNPMWGRPVSEETRQRLIAVNKGRKMGDEQRRQVSRQHAGELSSTAKVTNAQVAEMRAKHSRGARPKELQLEYGLSRASVWRILAGITFKETP